MVSDTGVLHATAYLWHFNEIILHPTYINFCLLAFETNFGTSKKLFYEICKTTACTCFILFVSNDSRQSGSWAKAGNSLTGTEKLGSTAAFHYNFYT